MFANKLIQRPIFAEGSDDVIAEAPCIGKRDGAPAAAGVGVTDDVEPVTAPAFTERVGCHQAINDFLQGVR